MGKQPDNLLNVGYVGIVAYLLPPCKGVNSMEERYLSNLRNNLFGVMGRKNWTATRLSIECGVPYRTLQSILTNEKRSHKLCTIVTIAENLNIPLAVLLGADEELEIGQYKRIVASVFNELKPYVVERTARA